MRNTLFIQTLLVPLIAAIFLYVGQWQALSALVGGAVALGNSLLLARRSAKARRELRKDPKADVGSMYVGALERFGFTLGAMALAMGWLKLDPPMLLIGFGIAYLAYPLGRAMAERSGARFQ